MKKRKITSIVLCGVLLVCMGTLLTGCGILLPNEPMKALSANNSLFRPFPLVKPRSLALPNPLFPNDPKR